MVVLELPLVLCAALTSRMGALPAMQAAGGIWTVALMLLAQGFQRSAYTILAVVASLLTFAGGMVYVRFFEHELEP